MNGTQTILAAVLLPFSVFTAYVVYGHGYAGFIELALAHVWGMQLFVDLCIALVLFLVWMWNDARDRGLSPVPYLILTCTLGSIGALIYLIRREGVPFAARAPRAA